MPRDDATTALSERSSGARRFPVIDWARTTLGPRAGWPTALETVARLMLHSRQPMFLAWGPDLAFLYNDAYAPILGARHPGALGQPFRQVWPEIWEELVPLVQRALDGQSTWAENLHLVMHRNGYPEDTWYTFSYSPLHDDEGRVAGMFCTCMETTRQVLAERALRENEGRFRALLDAAPAMMWVTDRDGHCTHLNRSWFEFTGQAATDAKHHDWMAPLHPDDRPEVETAFARAITDHAPFRLDYRMRHADGGWRWVIDAAEPRRDAAGRFLGHVGSVMDITDRREAEERQAMLAREVDHRAKNMLAVVQAALRLTRAPDQASYARAVEGRVAALARAQTLLANDRWAGADLRAMLEGELAAFLGSLPGSARCTLEGPPVALPAEAAQPLNMLVHELATNAAQHGALSTPGGRVQVGWQVNAGRLRLRWTETGGPEIPAPPTRRGFGTRVLEGTVRGQLGGRLLLDWRRQGLDCTLDLPLAARTTVSEAI
ncbi:sensor histidine kinase [Falsiroseomonas sp. HC035]|uniref:sensor histidine kinase n=1 Tax=Falsiroseomonas sp. HC035 TaxID=3390999 RepID=UPI003D30F54C